MVEGLRCPKCRFVFSASQSIGNRLHWKCPNVACGRTIPKSVTELSAEDLIELIAERVVEKTKEHT